MMMGDVLPTVPWSTTATWCLGLVGFLAVVCLGLQVAIAWKKIFGHQPPMDEQLARLVKSLREEISLGDAALGRRLDSMDDRLTESRQDRERIWKDMNEKITEVREDLSFL